MLHILAAIYPQKSIGLALLLLLVGFVRLAAAEELQPGADPTIVQVGGIFYAAEANNRTIFVRAAASLQDLDAPDVQREEVWFDEADRGENWAPNMMIDQGRTYIYFTSGEGEAHRMYYISTDDPTPLGDYSTETQLALPDDEFAIDGTYFVFEGQGWFVWSGWAADVNVEQSLYICRMDNPTTPVGARYIISSPLEPWEQGDEPVINEGPEAIVDPNGQLHIAYSANGSWRDRYCVADLRLRAGGDPTNSGDWFKSNGCLFGSYQDRLMPGWSPTTFVDGPGHHTWALVDGQVANSPTGTGRIPFAYHGVVKGTEYTWQARSWFTGTFEWRSETTYTRVGSEDTGYSFNFFEDAI